jgi:hypothetical protein
MLAGWVGCLVTAQRGLIFSLIFLVDISCLVRNIEKVEVSSVQGVNGFSSSSEELPRSNHPVTQ